MIQEQYYLNFVMHVYAPLCTKMQNFDTDMMPIYVFDTQNVIPSLVT